MEPRFKIGKTETGSLEAIWDGEELVLLLEDDKAPVSLRFSSRPFYLLDALREAVSSPGARVVWGKEGKLEVGAGFVIAAQHVEVLFKGLSPHLYVVVQDDREEWAPLIEAFKKLPV